MKRVLLVLTIIGLVTGTSAVASASHAWGSYHWKRSANPVQLRLVDNVTSQWDASFVKAKTDWDVSTVLALSSESLETSNKQRKKCAAMFGKIRVCNGTYGKNGWLGIAQIWISGGHIVQGVTKLNDSYHNNSPYNSPAWRNFVLCQEVGHTFGLGHQDETFGNTNLGSCMDYTNNPSTNQQPNAHDYEQLESIYAHLDGTTASTSSSSSSQSSDRADRRSRYGFGDCDTTVEQQDGKVKVTFVLPVDAAEHHH